MGASVAPNARLTSRRCRSCALLLVLCSRCDSYLSDTCLCDIGRKKIVHMCDKKLKED